MAGSADSIERAQPVVGRLVALLILHLVTRMPTVVPTSRPTSALGASVLGANEGLLGNSPLGKADLDNSRRKMVGRAGPWQLVRMLAETNLTRIYTARPADVAESQPIAYVVKMLRKEWWRDTSAIEIFRREAWVGSKVSHPHVVPILSANIRQPPFFLVMPLLTGKTLRECLDSGWQPTTPEVLWIARQIVEGLSALQQKVSMVHGDIKPDNLLISPAGHVTLLDLGFARNQEESNDWANRPVLGSLAYIAPELVTSAYSSGASSDQYSLGVLLYEMLAGRLPFEGSDPAELVAQHRGQKPPCLRKLRPDLPKSVASLVHTLLSKDPLRRGGSHAELTEQLVRLEIDSFAYRAGA